MLHRLNKKFDNKPAAFINWITGGEPNSTLCARLYLHTYYFERRNLFKVLLCHLIDCFEVDHCLIAAKHWRVFYIKNDIITEKYRKPIALFSSDVYNKRIS